MGRLLVFFAFPGLVAGLAPGGCCRGVVFRFHPDNSQDILNYLFDRELISDAYRPTLKTCYLENGDRISALVFISKTDHNQYAQRMPAEHAARIVSEANGPRGSNREYVEMTVDHLNSLGIWGSELHRVAFFLD